MIAEEVIKEVSANIDEILSLRNKKTTKEDGSFVTEGDLKCQKIILELIYFFPILDLGLILADGPIEL